MFLCRLPSTCIPQAPAFTEVQFCMYGEAVLIFPLGSNDITAAIIRPLGITLSPTSVILNFAFPRVTQSPVVNPWFEFVLTVISPAAWAYA